MTGGRVVSMHRRLIGLAGHRGRGARGMWRWWCRQSQRRGVGRPIGGRTERRRPVAVGGARSPSPSTGTTSRTTTRASLLQDARRRVHGGAPERHDRHQGPRERGVQDEAHDATPARRRRRTCSSRGAAAACAEQVEAGLVKDITARRRGVEGHDQPRRPGHVRRSTASSTASRSTSAWSASGTTRTCSRRPASRRRRRRGTSSSTAVRQLKDEGITPIALAGKDTWPAHVLVGVPRGPQRWPGRDGQGGHDRATGRDRPSSRPASSSSSSSTSSPSRRASWRRPWDGAGSEAAAMGNGKAAMQLMGQWAPGASAPTQSASSGHRRGPRLVPVPGRRRVAPAPRPTASAAATASPSARTRRPRRSTS